MLHLRHARPDSLIPPCYTIFSGSGLVTHYQEYKIKLTRRNRT